MTSCLKHLFLALYFGKKYSQSNLVTKSFLISVQVFPLYFYLHKRNYWKGEKRYTGDVLYYFSLKKCCVAHFTSNMYCIYLIQKMFDSAASEGAHDNKSLRTSGLVKADHFLFFLSNTLPSTDNEFNI